MPKLSEMAPAMRRRADRLGRAALQAAYWAAPENNEPVVFASRYGEIDRSVGMLEQLAAGEALSPTAFSMSVHNAIGALFSIARGSRGNYTAIAAGDETMEAAFTEALGLLADGAPRATVVYCEAPLPQVYAQFEKRPAFTRGWACRLVPTQTGGFSIEPSETCAPSSDDDHPSDLNILKFMLASNAPYFIHAVGNRSWQWSRHD